MVQNPMVSVLIITYNHEAFIEAAVESALMQQTTFPIEIVIGEDASTDSTRRIVTDFQKRFPDRIQMVLQHKNVGWRRNSVDTFRAARGKYVAWLEGDDYWTDPEKLQLQIEAMEANPNAFMCGARAMVQQDGVDVPGEVTPSDPAHMLATYGARELFAGRWWFRTCTKVFPRHVLQHSPERLIGDDWAGTLWCIAYSGFGAVAFIDRVVGVYRQHPGGVWTSMTRGQRLLSDVDDMYRLISFFSDRERVELRDLMLSSMEEAIRLSDLPRWSRFMGALQTVCRIPGRRSVRLLAQALYAGT